MGGLNNPNGNKTGVITLLTSRYHESESVFCNTDESTANVVISMGYPNGLGSAPTLFVGGGT